MSPTRLFGFRLGLALGVTDPDAMMARMPYHVLGSWLTYYELEPFGERQADLRAGIVAATIANCMARKKGQAAFRASDFMPQIEKRTREKPKTSATRHYQQALAITKLFGGKVVIKQQDQLSATG